MRAEHSSWIRYGALVAVLFGLAAAQPAAAELSDAPAPLLPAAKAMAIGGELSGSRAKLHIQAITLHHRIRGSEGFREAAEYVVQQARDAGLGEVEMMTFPADGKIFYGSQRSRPGWDARFAELWDQRRDATGQWRDRMRLASFDENPVTLAQDSMSGKVSADLVDVGAGVKDSDYAGKDVRGKLVLTSSQPGSAATLAIGRYGAAGIVSYAHNQTNAWTMEDTNLVRWGHMSAFNPVKGFGFMITPQRADHLRARLQAGDTVRLRAEVSAGQHPSTYLVPTGVIPGADRDHEIVFSCHLDHQRPGANDNASGCAGILEIARALSQLIARGELPRPRRTIRFIWPPEIEGTLAVLNGRPEFARRTLTNIHLDMIGGDPAVTKGILRVTRSPQSLPTFVNDVAWAFTRYLNEQSLRYAETGGASIELRDQKGDRQALQALDSPFTEGSDHLVWAEGSWRIPTMLIVDYPDRFIHTDRDLVDNIDPTKVRRAMFIAAATAWYLADLSESDLPELIALIQQDAVARAAETAIKAAKLRASSAPDAEIANLWRFHFEYEAQVAPSISRFLPPNADLLAQAARTTAGLQAALAPPKVATACEAELGASAGLVYRRAPEPKGPMTGMGYDYLSEHLDAAHLPLPALMELESPYGAASYDYEALNLVDGRRSVCAIRDDLSAIVEPVSGKDVAGFLETLAKLGVVQARRN